jgi:hypothetical protein
MAAAQTRLKGLAMAARRVMGIMKGLALGFLGLGTVFAGFAASKLFESIFSGAVQQAEEAERRTQKLTGALMANEKMRKLGMDVAKQQVGLLQQHNEELAKQQVLSADHLDVMTSQMALYRLSPKRLADANKIMADQLVYAKGARATEEDALGLAVAHGRAIMKGQVKGLEAYGIYLTKNEAKEFQSLAKAGKIEQAHARLLKIYQRMSAGRAAAERLTPTGRIVEFQKAVKQLSQDLGKEMLPVMADIADAWREMLPVIRPVLLSSMKAFGRVVTWLSLQVKDFIAVLQTPPAVEAWNNLKDAFSGLLDAVRLLGSAFGIVAPQTDSFGKALGQFAVSDMNKMAGDLRGLTQAIIDFRNNINQAKLNIEHFQIGLANGVIVISDFYSQMKQVPILGDVIKALEAFYQALYNFVVNPIGSLKGIWDTISQGAVAAWQTVTDVFTESVSIIMAALSQIGSAITSFLMTPINAVKNAWSGLVESFKNRPTWLGGTGGAPPAPAPVPPGAQFGGIFKQRSLLQVAERGPEAIIPLTGGRRAEGLLDYANRVIGMGRPAAGPTTVTFAPNVTINGSASEAEQRAMDSRLRDLASDFIKQFKAAQQQERRLSYESGYG